MIDSNDGMRPSLIQAGWAVYSGDGEYLGDVLGADQDRFLLPTPEDPTGRLELSTKLVIEEEPGEMWARISLPEDEVDTRHEGIRPIPHRPQQQAAEVRASVDLGAARAESGAAQAEPVAGKAQA